MRRLGWMLGLGFGLAAVVGVFVGQSVEKGGQMAGDGKAQPAPEPFHPVADVHFLMEGQEIHFKGVRDALENKELRNRLGLISKHAAVLAELANVNYYHSIESDYRGWAWKLRDDAMEVFKEAQKRGQVDESKIKTLMERLETTCTACHDKYQ